MDNKKYKKPGGKCNLLVGGSDTGKTYYLEKFVINPSIRKGIPLVIVDLMNQFKTEYPDLEFYDPSTEIISKEGFLDKNGARALFNKMRKEYSTGLYRGKIVIWEEASQMLTPQETGSSQAVIQMLNIIKHSGCILIFVYQTFNKIPADLIRLCDAIVIKKTFKEDEDRLRKIISQDDKDFWNSYNYVKNAKSMHETIVFNNRPNIKR